jgi:hypothetical protein
MILEFIITHIELRHIQDHNQTARSLVYRCSRQGKAQLFYHAKMYSREVAYTYAKLQQYSKIVLPLIFFICYRLVYF